MQAAFRVEMDGSEGEAAENVGGCGVGDDEGGEEESVDWRGLDEGRPECGDVGECFRVGWW